MKVKLIIISILLFTSKSFATQWFVNVNFGDDNNDGLSIVVGPGNVGPKKSIAAAYFAASPNDTIYISEGIYEEFLILNKTMVLRGNNWGIDPVKQARNAETVIVPPGTFIGTGISGNSAIEIQSCCIEIDGICVSGNNPNNLISSTKYDQQFEIGYCIAAQGMYSDLKLNNLILRNFYHSGIAFSSGVFSSGKNLLKNSLITCGENNSVGVSILDNFYSDIFNVKIDSTGTGILINNFSDKTNNNIYCSQTIIKAENKGVQVTNFSSNTDNWIFEYLGVLQFDTNISFNAFEFLDNSSKCTFDINNSVVSQSNKAFLINNCTNDFIIKFTDNSIFNSNIGYLFYQPIIAPAVSYNITNTKLQTIDSVAFLAYSEGGLLTLKLTDNKILQGKHGVFSIGNSLIDPGNTVFSNLDGYYFYLDSSLNGEIPTWNIDASNCSFNGTLGNLLTGKEAFRTEDRIRHFMDKSILGWVNIKNTCLFVTGNDGNIFVNRAYNKASNNWNIFIDSFTNNEELYIKKPIHFFTHRDAGISKITMDDISATLYLHGRFSLSEGLVLNTGIIETTNSDTLICYRNNFSSVLSKGNINSYVNGPLYIRYVNLPYNYNIADTIPIGVGNDYRPFYIFFKWQSVNAYSDFGFKVLKGLAPISNIPSGITHISTMKYWEITDPLNSGSFMTDSVGLTYSTTAINDLVNDPKNLRVIYNKASITTDIGGKGDFVSNGRIISSSSGTGFGIYTVGNAKGGNNILNPYYPVGLISTKGNCINDSIIISAENSRSDSAINNWEWKINGPSIVPTPDNSMKIIKKFPVIGKYTISLVVKNKFGLTDTVYEDINILPKPQLQYNATQPCYPKTIQLNNTSIIPPSTLISQSEWKIDTSLYTGVIYNYNPTTSGIHKALLKTTLNNGCWDTLTIYINSPLKPVLKLAPSGDTSICNGDSILAKITKSKGVIIWNDGNNYDSIKIKNNFSVKGTLYSSPQCFVSDSIKVNVIPVPVVDAGNDYTVLPGKFVKLQATSNGMVEWIPDTWLDDATILTPTARPLATTKYIVRAYNIEGCEAYDSMTLKVNSENISPIPNLLTPNGDGENDKWVLSNISDPENCRVKVFTREGLMVYSSESYQNDWGGTRNDKDLPDGYYIFIIEHKITNEVFTGILNIIK
ncbi:MAG: gliding motility-associated C-terminal domain-containing protein [Bacteroidetes bacterium]|nr:gliding motility-associated C-terminal domain-containing protein [Bacteroidota bacterium]